MKRTYKGSIERGKIDATAVYKTDDGRQFVSFVFTIDDDNPDQYGNVGSIRQDLGKDRREDPAVWLGKVKPLQKRADNQGGQRTAAPAPSKAAAVEAQQDEEDSIPF